MSAGRSRADRAGCLNIERFERGVLMTNKDRLTISQSQAIRQTARSHDALIEAQAHLHRALEMAQGRRAIEWARLVSKELEAAREKLVNHREEVRASSGLYFELQFESPRLIPRVRKISALLQQLEKQAADLAARVEVICGGNDRRLDEIRPEAEAMLQTLRTLMFQENDLIFERFREIGVPD